MRNFVMIRVHDESGVSGTGLVAEGTIFSDGATVVRWLPTNSPAHSTSNFNSFSDFMMVHVASHPTNQTQILFSDGETYEGTTKVKEARKPRKTKEKAAAKKG